MYEIAWFDRLQQATDGIMRARQPVEAARSLAATIPGLDEYVRSDAIGPMPSESGASQQEVFFDSYSCCWFQDESDFERARTSAGWAALEREQAPVLRHRVATGDERGGPRAHDQRTFWRNDHGRFVLEAPGVDRYLQSHVIVPTAHGTENAGEASVWPSSRLRRSRLLVRLGRARRRGLCAFRHELPLSRRPHGAPNRDAKRRYRGRGERQQRGHTLNQPPFFMFKPRFA